jgi:hypothetical protein
MPKRSEDPSFFTIIPISVLHDDSLSPNAKLLYAEITGLTKQTGYCWAQNQYFAKLYKTSERTIIRWINELQANGHISVHYQYFPNSKKIAKRLIYCTFLTKKPEPHPDGEEKLHIYAENCILSNPPDDLVVTKMSPLDELVVTKMSPPSGDKNVIDNNINSNRSSSSDDPTEIEKPPPDEEEAETFEKVNNYSENRAFENPAEESGPKVDLPTDVSQGETVDILSLKRFLRELKPSFVFSEGFYQKAVDFLAANGLDYNYVSWLYEFCVKRKPLSIENYFYKVFFDSRCAELYLEESKPPPVEIYQCPVCLTEYDSSLRSCPVCGLASSCRHDKDKILRQKRLFEMPAEVKNAYDEEYSNTFESTKYLDFSERSSRLKRIDQKYGLAE